jgi:glycosyltransferase involved in cell wall biosynthesis
VPPGRRGEVRVARRHGREVAADEVGWPDVCVVIPTRGRAALVRQAVESVVAQDYPGDLDILVVHDHEDPQNELKELARPGRAITVLVNTRTEGLSGSRNTGLERATAPFVASCDDDDFWDAAKLRLQIERMLADPELVVVGAGIRLLMTESRAVDWPGDRPVVTRADLLRSRRKELHSSTMVMRRELFDTIGGYDEKLPGSYGEDYELLLRAAMVGKVGVVNTPLASIRKYTPSWFRERAQLIVDALEYILKAHPEIGESRAGYARLLGTIAFARSTMGERRAAYGLAAKALRRWPLAPFGWLTLVQATTRVDPLRLLAFTRRFGRGIT